MGLILAVSPRVSSPSFDTDFFPQSWVNHLNFHAAASLPARQYLVLCSSYSLTFEEMNSEDERLAR